MQAHFYDISKRWKETMTDKNKAKLGRWSRSEDECVYVFVCGRKWTRKAAGDCKQQELVTLTVSPIISIHFSWDFDWKFLWKLPEDSLHSRKSKIFQSTFIKSSIF